MDNSVITASNSTQGGVLFISHDLGGGTEKVLHMRIKSAEAQGNKVYVLRPSSGEIQTTFIVTDYSRENSADSPGETAQSLNDFKDFLSARDIRFVEIHHKLGFQRDLFNDIINTISSLRLPIDVFIHDYFLRCPRIFMIDETERYCGDPQLNTCQACLKVNGSWDDKVPDITQWLSDSEELLLTARNVFAPSQDAASRIERHFSGITVKVLPHEIETLPRKSATNTFHSQNKIVVFGGISTAKGSKIISDVAKLAGELYPQLRFTIIGYTDRDSELLALGNVEITGPYEESTIDSKIMEALPDVVWFPGVIPETYSFTLSTAINLNIAPIVTFDIGAFHERLLEIPDAVILPLQYSLSPTLVLDSLAKVMQEHAQQYHSDY